MKIKTVDNNVGFSVFNQNSEGGVAITQVLLEPTDGVSFLVPEGYKLEPVSTGDDGSTTYAFAAEMTAGGVVYAIVVNGVEHPMALGDGTISYDQVVNLANMKGTPTVVANHTGPTGGGQGSLLPGGSVAVSERQRTVFNVAHAGSA